MQARFVPKLQLWEGSIWARGTTKLARAVYLWRQGSILGQNKPNKHTMCAIFLCSFLHFCCWSPWELDMEVDGPLLWAGVAVFALLLYWCNYKSPEHLGPCMPQMSQNEPASIAPQKGSGSLTWKCVFSYRNLNPAVCCPTHLLSQSPASPTDGFTHTMSPPAGSLSWTGHPCPVQRDFAGPSSLPWACRVHAHLPKGAVYVGLSSCPGTVFGRGPFWEWSPMTAKGLLPPYGFDRRGLDQGTRVEEVVARGASSTVLLCPPRSGSLCALGQLIRWSPGSHSTDCINVAEQQGFPKAALSVQGTCSSGLPWSCCALLEFVPNPIPAV